MYLDSISREAVNAAISELGGKVYNTPESLDLFTTALHKQFVARGVTFRTDEECVDLACHLAGVAGDMLGLVLSRRKKTI